MKKTIKMFPHKYSINIFDETMIAVKYTVVVKDLCEKKYKQRFFMDFNFNYEDYEKAQHYFEMFKKQNFDLVELDRVYTDGLNNFLNINIELCKNN